MRIYAPRSMTPAVRRVCRAMRAAAQCDRRASSAHVARFLPREVFLSPRALLMIFRYAVQSVLLLQSPPERSRYHAYRACQENG